MEKMENIIKKFQAKGYELNSVRPLADDITTLMDLKENKLNLPIREEKANTITYELNRTKKTDYWFENDNNIFLVTELITTGYKYLKNGKLRKINVTSFEIELNYEKYSYKNLKVFLGII